MSDTESPKIVTRNCQKDIPITSKSTNNEAYGTLKTVKHLFAKFTVWYGDAWAHRTQTDAWERVLEAEWLEVVRQMQLTDIGLVLNFLRSPDNSEYGRFPPTPLEFLQLPKKIKAKMIPTLDECFNAAMRSDWHFHPIVYPAATACDIYWLRSQASGYDARKRFREHYHLQKEKYLRGEPFIQPDNESKKLMKSMPEKDRYGIEAHLKLFKSNAAVRKKFQAAKTLREKLVIFRELIKPSQ